MASVEKRIQRRTVASTQAFPSVAPRLAAIYSARGVTSPADLDTSLSGLLPPQDLKGIDQASAILAEAITQQKRILVVGDFDADGATSCAVALLSLRAMGATWVDFLVPNRFEYGYGLTPAIVDLAMQYQPDLIVTVDNGIASIDGVARANQYGCAVVVTDHHLPGDQLPDAAAIVNPNQPGCKFGSKGIAGVGVIFYLMLAVRATLRELGYFAHGAEPNLAEHLDLVALGTVADVVPLDKNNRILVHQGLQRIRAGRCRPGISALLQVAGRQQFRATASDIGFAIGPRLNAAGRLDDMSVGIQCLLEQDPQRALEMAAVLNDFNLDRRAIEGSMQLEAEQALHDLQQKVDLGFSICLYNPSWHQGVIGILASRLKERYHRPCLIFAPGDEGQLKASGRSISGFHLRDALDEVATRYPHLLQKFGGHAMAAGLTIAEDAYTDFCKAFEHVASEHLNASLLEAVVLSDGELTSDDLQLPFAQLLRDAGPWGQAFPEPIFDGEFILVQQRIVGEKHLKCVLSPANDRNLLIDGIAFNVDKDSWPAAENARVKVAYGLDVNHFRGIESAQLMIHYLELLP